MTQSNTSGWSVTPDSFTCAEEFSGAPINSCVEPYTAMGGGKTYFKRNNTKKSKSYISMRKKLRKKTLRTKKKKNISRKNNKRIRNRLRQKTKQKRFYKEIIQSIEQNKPLSNDSIKNLSPSMRKFLEGIDTNTNSSSLRLEKFKPNKKKIKRSINGGNNCNCKGKCKCKCK